MTSKFGTWVKAERQAQAISQDVLAQRIESHLDRRMTRDAVAKLESGIPANPVPELVTAYAIALGRSLTEALEALGYRLPAQPQGRLDPVVVEVMNPLPLPVQRGIAGLIPGLLGLAHELRHEPLEVAPDKRETGRAPWKTGETALQAAEEKAGYEPRTRGRRAASQ